MSVGRICTRTVVCARSDETVRVAARRMVDEDVGTLVVTGPGGEPRGILTDRDVARCAANALDLDRTALAVVVAHPVVTIGESESIEEGLARMGARGVRRLVVVDAGGRLVGLLALDDVLELLVDEAASIGRLLRRRGGTRRGGVEESLEKSVPVARSPRRSPAARGGPAST